MEIKNNKEGNKQNLCITEYNKIFENLWEFDFDLLDHIESETYSFSSLADIFGTALSSIEREYFRLENNGLVNLIIVKKMKLTKRGKVFLKMLREDLGDIKEKDSYPMLRSGNEDSLE